MHITVSHICTSLTLASQTPWCPRCVDRDEVMHNAVTNYKSPVTACRYPGRQMSQQMASLPAGRAVAKHSRLDELLTQLSP